MSLEFLGASYRVAGRDLVREVSFTLGPGQVLGLVGPNGAGKTTLLGLASRLHAPSAGEVRLEGRKLASFGRLELARRVALLAQTNELPPDHRVYDLVMMGRTPHLGLLAPERPEDHARVREALERCDLWTLRERCAPTLSGGERQRLALARALAQEPRYLLLDEPTNGLDLGYQAEVLRLVREAAGRGLGVLAVLHDLNLAARVCDRLVVLDRGRVVAAGPPAEVLTRALLERVYGPNVELLHPGPAPVVLPRL